MTSLSSIILTPWDYGILIGMGLLVGIINTLSGGGSLLTLPFLIELGLPPTVANGTNRIGILLGSTAGSWGFKSKNALPIKEAFLLSIPAIIGALTGASISVSLNEDLFKKIIGIILVLAVLMIIFQKKPKRVVDQAVEQFTKANLQKTGIAFFFLGIYGGFIQAGLGFLFIVTIVGINQSSLVSANAIKVTVIMIYTFFVLIYFIMTDKVAWIPGILLGVGNIIGGWFSSRLSVKKGDQWIKPILIIMVLFMAFRLWQ